MENVFDNDHLEIPTPLLLVPVALVFNVSKMLNVDDDGVDV